jgi:hypothetical protein
MLRQRDMPGCWDFRFVYIYDANVYSMDLTSACDALRIVSLRLPCHPQPLPTDPASFDFTTAVHCALLYPYSHLVVVCELRQSIETQPSRSPTVRLHCLKRYCPR